jgi:DGQHR domain-containing protein
MRISNVLQIVDASGLTYYLGTISPAQIMELTFVPCVVRANDDVLVVRTNDGYQREGDGKRMKQIQEFYSSSLQSLVPPILLSTRGTWRFIPSAKGSTFGAIDASDLAAVIDGQHRLGGLSMLAQDASSSSEAKNRSIPFMAVDLLVEKESEEFETINGKQKGIKPSHLKYIRRGETFTGNAATMLKEDEDSIFFERIAIDKRKDHDIITFGSACNLVDATFNNYFCSNTKFRPAESEENQAKAMQFLMQYWKIVSQVFNVMWSDISKLPSPGSPKTTSHPGRHKFEYRLLEETGLSAFARLSSQILWRAWIPASSDIAWATVENQLIKVSNDSIVNLALQKLKPENRDEILAINPLLVNQGQAGVTTLYNVILGALDKA